MTIYSGTVLRHAVIGPHDRIKPGTSFAASVEVSGCPAFTGSPGCLLDGHPIAFGKEADERIKRIAETVAAEPKRLVMNGWHCGTAHCVAGWGVHQEGEVGYALERQFGDTDQPTANAGLVLLGLEAGGMFYAGEDTARAWLSSKLEQSA